MRRWTRYGHDRPYVTAADGTRLGWLDLKTGEKHLEVKERAVEFRAAIAQSGYTPSGVVGETRPPDPAHEPRWQDLSHNRPGQSAREEAEQR